MRSTIFCKLYKIYIMRTYFSLLLFLCMQNVFAQAPLAVETDSMSVENLFLQQMSHFPQEKLYLQTDRGIYMSGETLLVQGTFSRCPYAKSKLMLADMYM